MNGFTPVFNPSGTGSSEGAVPDPGTTAGTSRYLREDATWAVPGAGPPGPPAPSPGLALDQWACNAAGYLIYDLCYKLVKSAVDTNLFVLGTDAIIAFAFDSLSSILLPLEILDAGFLTWLENWVSTEVQANLATFEAHLLDQVLWSKFHCFLYNQIRTAGGVTNTILLAAGTALAASSITPGLITNGVALILQQFGVMSVGPVPLSAFVQNYDCSTCAGSGTSSAPIPIQAGFDLVVSDGTHRGTFIDDLEIIGASVAVVNSVATMTIPSPGTGTVTNVSVTVPADESVTVSNPTTTPSIAITRNAESGNVGLLSPADGSSGTPTFRSIVSLDLAPSPSDGDILHNEGGTGVWQPAVFIPGQTGALELLQFGLIPVADSTGADITILVVGATYSLQSFGGPWNPDGNPADALSYGWDVSIDGGTTWFNVWNDSTNTPPTFPPPTLSKPSWADSAIAIDAHHARITFVATTTSIRMRVHDTIFSDNTGTFEFELLGIQFGGSAGQVSHNGIAIGTEPTLDIEDSGTVAWVVSDDSTNRRIQVTAELAGVGSVTPTDGQLPIGNGTGFTLAQPTAGAGITLSLGAGSIEIAATAGGGSLTVVHAILSADVPMANANQFYDALSISCSAGTWVFLGMFCAGNTGSATDFSGKIWDGGSNVYGSAQSARHVVATISAAVIGYAVLSGTTTIKLSVAGDNTSSAIHAALGLNPAGNNATQLIAVKVA